MRYSRAHWFLVYTAGHLWCLDIYQIDRHRRHANKLEAEDLLGLSMLLNPCIDARSIYLRF